MKKTLSNLLLYSLLISLFLPAVGKAEGQSVLINRAWKFTLGDPQGNPATPSFDDSEWEQIGLPHSFSIPYFRSKNFYIGYGWYRKTLDYQSAWKDKLVFLDFDGVFQEAEVFVNGQLAGKHQGGYAGFRIDITPYLQKNTNHLAIRVNNLWNARLAPRAGEHVFAGGIYRDVYLTVCEPVHIARDGIFVSTPAVSEQTATVQVTAEINNLSDRPSTCHIQHLIKDRSGKKISTQDCTLSLQPGETQTATSSFQPISRPHLWSPETPYLYQVETILTENGQVKDRTISPLGFRWMEWTADQGFFLNGKHYYMQGVNVHQDHAGWGDAVTQAGIYRDIKLMKDAGFNMIRGSHYPHHPYFAQVCDELGMLFLSENCVWGIGGFQGEGYWDANVFPPHVQDESEYIQSARTSLANMIRINRNHPSIIAWSMCNEAFFTSKELLPKVKSLLTELVALSHQLDPTRIAVIGGSQRGGVDVLGDAAGYNGDGATLFRNPGFPNMVCEYGSCVSDRPGDYTPCWGSVTDGEQPAWRSGHAIWCGFDHGSIAGDMGKMGIVDYFRIPKRSWYWYRNYHLQIAPPEWPEEGTPAALRLQSDKKRLRGTDGTDDALITVTVTDAAGKPLSNSPVVRLSIVSGPGEFPTGRSITFKPTTADDIRIQDGQAAIEFRSYEGGKTRIKAESEGLKTAWIEIKTDGLPVYKEGVTPTAKDRVYNPDIVYRKLIAGVSNISEARPTQASSVVAGSSASFANDGKESTAWTAEATDKHPFWKLDMENFYKVKSVELSLAPGIACSFAIELSDDEKNWRTVKNEKSTGKTDTLTIVVNDTQRARFIRLVFTGIPPEKAASIQEIRVMGES